MSNTHTHTQKGKERKKENKFKIKKYHKLAILKYRDKDQKKLAKTV